jgi:hypothetical protein
MHLGKWFKRLVLLLAVGFLPAGAQAAQVTLRPSQDVHIWTFGGGQGGNAFLRFNISPVPGGAAIDSVILELWVWSIAANWDRDVKFWNVNSQTWAEADSARVIWAIPTSDTILQASGFAAATGWARSVNLAPIFLRDYNLSRTFMSLKLKDPDDRTTTLPPGSLPVNAAETLAVGNQAFTQQIYTSPRECADTTHRPRLTVFYSVSGVEQGEFSRPLSGFALTLPGVQQGDLRFTLTLPRADRVALALFDLSGRKVASSEITAPQGRSAQAMTLPQGLRSGLYFLRAASREGADLRKVLLLD